MLCFNELKFILFLSIHQFDTGVGEVHNYNVEKFINAYEVIDGCCIVLD
mgnify:CR=1 FL=1